MGIYGLGNLQECKDNFFFMELDGVDNVLWLGLVSAFYQPSSTSVTFSCKRA